jgi:uncharacterized membrane protein YagU involved in acid resistance
MSTATINRSLTGVLLGGGTAATLDIIYAIVRNGGYGKSPLWVLQSVASGWTGNDAFTSGIYGGILGLVSHYGVLLVAAAIYLVASRSFPILRSRAIACGALFGVLIYLFMNFVVLPLSAFPFDFPYPLPRLLEGFVSHAILVGLPIALAIRRYS